MANVNAQDAYLDQLYQILPRANRGGFRAKLIDEESNFAFKQDADDIGGRWFAVAVGDFPAPVAQMPLTAILRQIAGNFQHNYVNLRDSAKEILMQYLNELELDFPDPPQGGGKRRRTKKSKRRSKSKSKSKSKRRH